MLKTQPSPQLPEASCQVIVGFDSDSAVLTSLEESISGLRYFPDFLDDREGRDLLKEIDDRNEWEQEIQSRRTLQYGYHYNYMSGGGLKMLQGGIPTFLKPITEKIENSKDGLWKGPEISQIILNEYTGMETYISKHIDSLDFGPTVAIISLVDPCLIVMHERIPKDPTVSWNANETIPIQELKPTGRKIGVILKPGSLLVLNGEARYMWQHEIPKQCLWKKFLGNSWKTLAFGNEEFNEKEFRSVSLTMRSVVVDVVDVHQ